MVEAAGIESVNQRRPSRPTRPQSHATLQKSEGRPRLAAPEARPRLYLAARQCQTVPRQGGDLRDSKIPSGQSLNSRSEFPPRSRCSRRTPPPTSSPSAGAREGQSGAQPIESEMRHLEPPLAPVDWWRAPPRDDEIAALGVGRSKRRQAFRTEGFGAPLALDRVACISRSRQHEVDLALRFVAPEAD